MKFSRWSACALLAVTMSQAGCYHVKYSTPGTTRGDSHGHMPVALLWGFVTVGDDISLSECGAPGIYKIDSRIGVFGLIVGGLTGGLIIPWNVKVICAEAKGAGLAPEREPLGWSMVPVSSSMASVISTEDSDAMVFVVEQ